MILKNTLLYGIKCKRVQGGKLTDQWNRNKDNNAVFFKSMAGGHHYDLT